MRLYRYHFALLCDSDAVASTNLFQMLRYKLTTEYKLVLLMKGHYQYNKKVLSFDLDEAIAFVEDYKPNGNKPKVVERWKVLLGHLITIRENYVDMYETNTRRKVIIKPRIVSKSAKKRKERLKLVKELRKLEFLNKWKEMQWAI